MREETVKLEDHEFLVKANAITGEGKDLRKAMRKLEEGKELFKDEGDWVKKYKGMGSFLRRRLSMVERDMVSLMTDMAQFGTNSLDPLDDEKTSIELSEYFGVHRNYIKKSLKNLYDLGVYGKFSVSEIDKHYKKYWILNPYISYGGNIIDSDIKNLFKNTEIAEYHFKLLRDKKALKNKK